MLELASASQKRLPLLVMTFAYADPIDLPAFEAFGSAIQEGGGQLLPVYLQGSVDEIIRRVGNDDRAIRKKMTSAKDARDFLEKYKLAPGPRPDCLVLDSEANSADENALSIIRHFGLAEHHETMVPGERTAFPKCVSARCSRQCEPARTIASAVAPTRIRLTAQIVSRLNQLRDTNFKPR